ncbi:hypothetical protein D7Y05_10440 [bacterium 1XD42-54]|nr:hypothetical protein D7Y05_10440 [bacterium 1XD42-54]
MFWRDVRIFFQEDLAEEREYTPLWKYILVATVTSLMSTTVPDMLWKWQENQKYVTVKYKELDSELQEQEDCFLCGSHNRTMLSYYRQVGGIGVISFNDWYVTDFDLQSRKKSNTDSDGGSNSNGVLGEENASSARTMFGFVNKGDIRIEKESMASGRRASITVRWPEGLLPDLTLLKENLCQSCLDNVLENQVIRKKKYDDKIPVPFCVVDFDTLELYSLQDTHTTFSTGDYWIEVREVREGLEMNAYYLPILEKNEKVLADQESVEEDTVSVS